MKLELENTKSERTHELANLIRAYNRANREPSKSEPLNIYLEIEKISLYRGEVLLYKRVVI